MKENRRWGEKHVYLAKSFFTLDFSSALAVLLHEWGHTRGYDGSRSFTDALTEFIAEIIRERKELDAPEREWKKISAEIKEQNKGEKSSIHESVDCLTSEEKSKLLRSLPEEELFQLLQSASLL